MQKHKCIKCSEEYMDDDVDAYLCETCNNIRIQVAKEVDAKASLIQRVEVKSDLQMYDELRKANGGKFPSIKQMGIKL